MNRQVLIAVNGRETMIDIEVRQIGSYGRSPLWEASDHYWPSIPSVTFRMSDQGNGNIEREAARLLGESERDTAID